MDRGIRLFSVRGIDLRVHVTFPLVLVWASLQFGLLRGQGWPGAVLGVLVTLLLFGIVVLHELGHSFAAQYYGVPVKQIVLLPIGGVAQLARIPEEPLQEFVIAIAGPLVNFGIAALMFIANLLLGLGSRSVGSVAVLAGAGDINLGAVLDYVFVSNLFLGLFNLIPAFPMDGGRVLRALVATRVNYVRATMIAVAIGQGFALLMGLWGLIGGGFFMILVAFFVYTSASQEGRLVRVRRVLGNLTVEQVYSRDARALSPSSSLHDAVQFTLRSFQSDFPVCDGEQLVGLLPHNRMLEALDRYAPHTPVAQIMLSDVLPVSPSDTVFSVQQRLMESRLEALPVVQGGRFLGLITKRDISEVLRVMSSQPDLVATTEAGRA
jgi:stage IV sporulation protein FB